MHHSGFPGSAVEAGEPVGLEPTRSPDEVSRLQETTGHRRHFRLLQLSPLFSVHATIGGCQTSAISVLPGPTTSPDSKLLLRKPLVSMVRC